MPAAALRETQSLEDHISKRNFEKLSRFIYDYSGIKMPLSKTTMLEGRLRRRLRATGISSFDAYCDYLFDQGGLEAERTHLIDAVTTNKTDFFREPRHFDYMRDVALPTLAARGTKRLRAWSSACSTGAEPYTMAMVLQSFVEQEAGMDYSILATDLSTDVLATAHRGIFNEELVAPVPPEMRRRWVMNAIQAGRREIRISPLLRSKIGFARLNLMDPSYGVGDAMDIIFCRNVLIYFDKATQIGVLKRLCDNLKSGGYLFIGHSETLTGVDIPVTQVANTVFRKA